MSKTILINLALVGLSSFLLVSCNLLKRQKVELVDEKVVLYEQLGTLNAEKEKAEREKTEKEEEVAVLSSDLKTYGKDNKELNLRVEALEKRSQEMLLALREIRGIATEQEKELAGDRFDKAAEKSGRLTKQLRRAKKNRRHEKNANVFD